MTTKQETSLRQLSDTFGTRYIELSTLFEQDVCWHPSVTITLAAFTDQGVMLHRLKSEETTVRFDLSKEEITALISGYTAYIEAYESEATEPDEGPLASLDELPF